MMRRLDIGLARRLFQISNCLAQLLNVVAEFSDPGIAMKAYPSPEPLGYFVVIAMQVGTFLMTAFATAIVGFWIVAGTLMREPVGSHVFTFVTGTVWITASIRFGKSIGN